MDVLNLWGRMPDLTTPDLRQSTLEDSLIQARQSTWAHCPAGPGARKRRVLPIGSL
jgi:hypothetical protein